MYVYTISIGPAQNQHWGHQKLRAYGREKVDLEFSGLRRETNALCESRAPKSPRVIAFAFPLVITLYCSQCPSCVRPQ